jgi:hypothetical protein
MHKHRNEPGDDHCREQARMANESHRPVHGPPHTAETARGSDTHALPCTHASHNSTHSLLVRANASQRKKVAWRDTFCHCKIMRLVSSNLR